MNSFAQQLDGSRVLLHSVVIDSLQYPKTKLRDKSREWIGKTFTNAKTVITSDTEDAIVGTYSNSHKMGLTTVDWDHDFTIDLKDNKVRVQIWVNKNSGGFSSSTYFFNNKGEVRSMYTNAMTELMQESAALVSVLTNFLKAKGDDW